MSDSSLLSNTHSPHCAIVLGVPLYTSRSRQSLLFYTSCVALCPWTICDTAASSTPCSGSLCVCVFGCTGRTNNAGAYVQEQSLYSIAILSVEWNVKEKILPIEGRKGRECQASIAHMTIKFTSLATLAYIIYIFYWLFPRIDWVNKISYYDLVVWGFESKRFCVYNTCVNSRTQTFHWPASGVDLFSQILLKFDLFLCQFWMLILALWAWVYTQLIYRAVGGEPMIFMVSSVHS